MKQAILNLKKKLLIVELPEGTIDESEYIATICMVPKDYWKLIGKPTDITEIQFAEWVDKFNNGAFRNYKDEYPFYPDFDTDNFFLTAKESFFSYLEKEGIYFENKLLKPADDDYSFYTDRNISAQEEWQEAESKVWKKEQSYLFQILN